MIFRLSFVHASISGVLCRKKLDGSYLVNYDTSKRSEIAGGKISSLINDLFDQMFTCEVKLDLLITFHTAALNVWDTVKTYLSTKRTPDEKSKCTPVKNQNNLPTKSKRTIDKVKTYPLLLTIQGQLIDKWFVIDSYC